MSQDCPLCGHRDIAGAILRHIGNAEMRLDRGRGHLEELTTAYMIKALDVNPGTCYRQVRGLVMEGMLDEQPKQHIKLHMVVPTYRLSEAGRALWNDLQTWDRTRENVDRLRGT